MILKIKAFIYRLTGIYLAHKEEKNYLRSKLFWKELNEIALRPDNTLTVEAIANDLIKTWHYRNGFFGRKYE